MERKSVLPATGVFFVLLLATVLTVPLVYSAQSARLAPQQSTERQPITIPFESANRHIILKVMVNKSRPLSFVLDTGDKYAVINLDRARELGLNLGGPVRMGGAGAEASMGAFVRDASFTIAGLDGFTQPVTLALPIGRLASRLGRDFDGIIGHDFIEKFVVEIDYQARQLKLHDKKAFKYSGSGESVPIKINSAGHPIIDAEVTPEKGAPIKGRFVVDIGAGLALVLHSPTVREYQLPGPGAKTIKALGAAGAGGSVSGQLGRIAELRIGSFRIKHPITFFAQDTAGAFANEELVGNIGAQVMNRFRVFLDYGRERIILEPNSTFSKPYDRAFTGLSIEAQGKDYSTFRITEVIEDSPASEVQLQKDDVIIEVDGRPSSGFTLSSLNAMFERPVAYLLTVRRGDQTMKVKLIPTRMI